MKNLALKKTSKARISKITSKGEVIINFSQKMMIPPNITGINQEALELRVVATNIEIKSWKCTSKLSK